MSYRWMRNGLYLTDDARVTGSGDASMEIAKVQGSDAGSYSVRVSNQTGSVASASAALGVLMPFPAMLLATSCSGSPPGPGGTLTYIGTVTNVGSVAIV